MGSRQKAFDIFVKGIKDHEDRWHLLIQPFHHGQGHGLAQVVPAKRHHKHVGLGLPFPGGDLALFYHGHVTLVVKEDHLEFVVSGRGGGDDDAVGQVGVGDGDAKEMGALPIQFQGDLSKGTDNKTINILYGMAVKQPPFFTLKMESVPKIATFGLKMIVKSGLEKIFSKFLHAEAIFF
jgi:hypothetical protein